MNLTWTVGVLADGVENVVRLDAGEAATEPAALASAVAALRAVLAAENGPGRAEYRITAGDRQIILIPGLNVAGRIDLDALDLWPTDVGRSQ